MRRTSVNDTEHVLIFGNDAETLAVEKVLRTLFGHIRRHGLDPGEVAHTLEKARWETTACVFIVPAMIRDSSYPLRLIRHIRLDVKWPGAVLVVAEREQANLANRWGFFRLQLDAKFVAQLVLPRPILISGLTDALLALRPYRPVAWRQTQKLLAERDEICRFCSLFEQIERKVGTGAWPADPIASFCAELTKADGIIRMVLGHSAMNALRPYAMQFVSANAVANWGSLTERARFVNVVRAVIDERVKGWASIGC